MVAQEPQCLALSFGAEMSERRLDRQIRVRSLESISDEKINWRRRSLWAMTVFVVGSLVLASVAPVHKVVMATGEIVLSAETVLVEHSTGGDVTAVFTERDATIAEGDPIIQFAPRALNAEIANIEIQRAHLTLRRVRLNSLLGDAPFKPPIDSWLSPLDLRNAANLYEAEKADFESERAALEARLAESRAEVSSLTAALASQRSEFDAYREQADVATQLARRDLGTRRAALDAEAQAAAAKSRYVETEGRLVAAGETIAQLKAERRRITARRRAEWSTSLTQAAEELARVEAALVEAYARRDALLVVAPISGRVLALGSEAPGDVIAPGELIASIVPAGDDGAELMAEVRISPDDIGQIGLDAEATVEVTTFQSDVFGEINGKLASVSPTSIAEPNEPPMFRARLALDRVESVSGETKLRLAPGMLVTATLVTTERSLIDYLAEPITRVLKIGFTE